MSKSDRSVLFSWIVTGLYICSVHVRSEKLLSKTFLNPNPQVKPVTLSVFLHCIDGIVCEFLHGKRSSVAKLKEGRIGQMQLVDFQ